MLLLLKVVPKQAGLVRDVEDGVEAEAGAQPPLDVAQHLVARQTEDRGHVVQVCHLTALAPSQVPEQYICKIPSLMLCYLLVGTLFPVSKINIQHQLTCLGLALHWAALAAPPLLVPLDPLSLVTLHLLQLDDQVLTVLAMDNINIYSFFMKEMKNIFEKLGAGGYKQVSFYFKNIYSCSSWGFLNGMNTFPMGIN